MRACSFHFIIIWDDGLEELNGWVLGPILATVVFTEYGALRAITQVTESPGIGLLLPPRDILRLAHVSLLISFALPLLF